MSDFADEYLLAVMIAAAREAGQTALRLRREGLDPEAKADSSPVTQADRLAETIICRALDEHWPAIPVVAEEAFANGTVPSELGRRFFLVDPIDGTREFVAGRDEFTVNIALMEDRYPLAGVVYAPARDDLFAGSPQGATRARGGARPEAIRASPGRSAMRALASRSHRTAETNAFLERYGVRHVEAVGSSLKFCLLAAGEADLYPCFGPTMEWDTAAGQAVLEAAGGHVCEPDGTRLAYGRREGLPAFRNPSFVARGAFSASCWS